jgi:hypothetical protein
MNPNMCGLLLPDQGVDGTPMLVLAGWTGITGGFGATTPIRRPHLE